jgi:ABC-type nitrate/sulfonate/bicarbonate transport system substrate-binding protein
MWVRIVLIAVIITVIITGIKLLNNNHKNKDNLQDISIRLKWLHQAQFAGFYYAKEAKLYEEKGLNVTLYPGGIDYPAIQMVTSGSDDFGVTAADQILLARDKGIPVVAIACIYRKSPFVLFALKESGITKVEEFRGKKIGLKLGGNEELTYRAMMKKAGLQSTDVDEIPVKFDISPLLSKTIDVWPGYSINEPITAEENGKAVNLIWPDTYGIHLYADVLFTTEEKLRTQPSVVKAVVEATIEGWKKSFTDREKAIEYTLKQSKQLNKGHERKMLDASYSLVVPDDKPIGWMDMSVWENMYQLLRKSEFIKTDIVFSQAFRVDFIPKKENE